MAGKVSVRLRQLRLLLAVFLALFDAANTTNGRSGLITRSFRGLHNIQEVECSGEFLDPGTSVLSMSLYLVRNDTVLASVNVATGACLTAGYFSSCTIDAADSRGSFSSCRIDEANSRRTRLAALVVDLEYGEERVYGCNVSVVESGTRMVSFSWRVTVKRVSARGELNKYS
nr:hypothetical protein BaRGS_015731 [Batillaria attramentaria]